MRNPDWIRDEVILALDVYRRHPRLLGKDSPEIRELSKTLRRLRARLGDDMNDTLRNPAGVEMKMRKFHSFNPDFDGVGLGNASKLDAEVFRTFWAEPSRLKTLAQIIRDMLNADEPIALPDIDDTVDYEIAEGRLLTRIHRYRERDGGIVARKKRQAMSVHGRLSCDGCSFDFADSYGACGKGFIECHHTKPVSQMRNGETTRLTDLALVCSNCHRMIHRRVPWLTIDNLRNILRQNIG